MDYIKLIAPVNYYIAEIEDGYIYWADFDTHLDEYVYDDISEIMNIIKMNAMECNFPRYNITYLEGFKFE